MTRQSTIYRGIRNVKTPITFPPISHRRNSSWYVHILSSISGKKDTKRVKIVILPKNIGAQDNAKGITTAITVERVTADIVIAKSVMNILPTYPPIVTKKYFFR